MYLGYRHTLGCREHTQATRMIQRTYSSATFSDHINPFTHHNAFTSIRIISTSEPQLHTVRITSFLGHIPSMKPLLNLLLLIIVLVGCGLIKTSKESTHSASWISYVSHHDCDTAIYTTSTYVVLGGACNIVAARSTTLTSTICENMSLIAGSVVMMQRVRSGRILALAERQG